MNAYLDEGFTFISHASEDKRGPVRLLVEALAREGLSLFVDRPGQHDASCMGLPEAFIARHRIHSIPLGVDWTGGVMRALREARTVLLCLSSSALTTREVLRQEVAFAEVAGKLLTCLVDETEPDHFGAGWGMVQAHLKQTVRINIPDLERALRWLKEDDARLPTQLPGSLLPVWETIRVIAEACRAVRPLVLPQAMHDGAADLLDLLETVDLPSGLARRVYMRSLPDAHRKHGAGGTLAGMLAILADSQPAGPGLPSPLVEFAERLGQEQRSPKLVDWVDRHCDQLQRTRLRQRLTREGRREAWAIIVVDIDDDERVPGLTWWVNSNIETLSTRAETVELATPLMPRALPAMLGRVLLKANELVGAHVRPRVALLLSHRLLAKGLDAVEITEPDDSGLGESSMPLCRRWPVTLHWRNRLVAGKSGQAINIWNQTRKDLLARCAAGDATEIVWSDTNASRVVQLAAHMRDPEANGVCLGFHIGTALEACIKECLREGLPWVVWFRESGTAREDHLEAVSALFGAHKPTEAPWRAAERRRQAGPGEPFEHLSILWDTPEHLGQV